MQTTHKIPGSSATRWSRYLLSQRSRADYQLGDGDRAVPTRWYGSPDLLGSLGLSADQPVKLEDLRPLMHGYSPVDGEPIRPVGADGTRTAGVDLTFSPPKDVSALWAVSSPYRRAQLEAAHRQAVGSALARIEREVAVVRRKTNGVIRFEKAKSLLAAETVHTTSRLSRDQDADGIPDPQLHSHVAVIAAERTDGKVAAVESRQLYLAARESGGWYRAELADQLENLGLQIERRAGNGERYFGIQGVPDGLSDRWSVRTGDVDRAANTFRRRYGREPEPGELDSLTLKSRGPKSTANHLDIDQAWRSVGQEYDLTHHTAEQLYNDQHITSHPEVDLADELLIEVTRERSMMTTRELRARAYELSAGVCRPADADRLVNELERSGELVRLEQGMWTTRALREIEHATIGIAEQRSMDTPALVSNRSLGQARLEIERELQASLTQEQRQALETITGPGGVSVLVGQAGTGKGVVLSTAARAWQLEGNEVIGTAIAGATAKRLGADAKLDRSMTTDSLMNGIERGHVKLDRSTVVIMDEAGMADSDRLPRLVKLTTEHESKLLLAGDSAQLSSIGPGGLFKELEQRVPTAELKEVHRARHEWERAAWQEIRDGEPGRALARYQAHDRLHIHDTRQHAMQAMVEDWDEARRSVDGSQAVMITDASNVERDQMNAMAQERLAKSGELGSHRVHLPGKPYGLAAGDQVIFTRQFRIPGQQRVENGILGTITHTSRDEDRVMIKTRGREPRELEVDTKEFSELSLSYAVHVYKAQGLTAEHTVVLTGGWQTDREHTYVAATRARERTDIHVTRDDLGDIDPDAIQHLAELMRRSRAQEASITRDTARRDTGRDHEHEAPTPARSQPDISLETENRSQRALREHRERERERSLERNHDIGFGIE